MDQRPAQQNLFGDALEKIPPVAAVVPANEILRVANLLPRNLHLGTSSWTFPGWAGIVYAGIYGTPVLGRHGLAAYARHPLLNCVGLDSSFYRPSTVEQLAQYAAEVPDDFRFVVKAYSGLTTAPSGARAGRLSGESVFLDADFATRKVILPTLEGLGSKLAAVLFQFSPLGFPYTNSPTMFVRNLQAFLGDLPVGPTYAVELRDPQILGPDYEEALCVTGAVHCRSVHSRMPPVDEQVADRSVGPLLIRWMLQPGDNYESAGARFSPFDRLREPDDLNRMRIVRLVRSALSAGRDVHVVAANNAEGSAPLTLVELAKAVATPV